MLQSDGRVFWGRDQDAWLCRCDCGTEVRVPQRRLTTQRPAHQYHACDACRAVPCEVCGKPVAREAKAKTCSPECKSERQRRYQLAYYHSVRAGDTDDQERRAERKRARYAALSPEEKLALSRKQKASEDQDHVRARNRRRHQERMLTDPEYADKKQADRDAVMARSGADAVRDYHRDYARKRRAMRAELEMLRAADALRGGGDE